MPGCGELVWYPQCPKSNKFSSKGLSHSWVFGSEFQVWKEKIPPVRVILVFAIWRSDIFKTDSLQELFFRYCYRSIGTLFIIFEYKNVSTLMIIIPSTHQHDGKFVEQLAQRGQRVALVLVVSNSLIPFHTLWRFYLIPKINEINGLFHLSFVYTYTHPSTDCGATLVAVAFRRASKFSWKVILNKATLISELIKEIDFAFLRHRIYYEIRFIWNRAFCFISQKNKTPPIL